MTETTNDRQSLSDATDAVSEIDDVEAHGLREVAAAATIGAAVVGAGGVALASVDTPPVVGAPAIVQQTSHQGHDLTADTEDATAELAGAIGSDASRFANRISGNAHQIVDPQLQQLTGRVHTVALTASDVTADAGKLATRTVSQTASTAVGAAGSAESVAVSKVGAISKSALKVVSATKSAVDQGWDLSVSVFGAKARTGGDMLDPTGRVTITNAAGHVLTSAKIGNGICKLHVGAVGEHQTLTIHYAGDDYFSAVQVLWSPPVGF